MQHECSGMNVCTLMVNTITAKSLRTDVLPVAGRCQILGGWDAIMWGRSEEKERATSVKKGHTENLAAIKQALSLCWIVARTFQKFSNPFSDFYFFFTFPQPVVEVKEYVGFQLIYNKSETSVFICIQSSWVSMSQSHLVAATIPTIFCGLSLLVAHLDNLGNSCLQNRSRLASLYREFSNPST